MLEIHIRSSLSNFLKRAIRTIARSRAHTHTPHATMRALRITPCVLGLGARGVDRFIRPETVIVFRRTLPPEPGFRDPQRFFMGICRIGQFFAARNDFSR